MKTLNVFLAAMIFLCGLAYSQGRNSGAGYGARGLAITKEILTKLSLPSWCWNGAHVFENVQHHYGLVDGKLLDKYLNNHSKSGLIDPQQILDPEQRGKLEELIATHDMKSAMPISINVLWHGQSLALSEDELKLHLLKKFQDNTAIVVFYYYGYARGAKGYVLLDGQGFIDDWEVDELFIRSSRDASLQLENFSELETFITDISKRSFWLEKKLFPPVVREKKIENKSNGKKKLTDWGNWLLVLNQHSFTLFLALLILLAGAWYFIWSYRWRKFVIYESDVPVRLGADYGACVSDLIEFSDPKVSLSEQCEKLKNKEL